MKKFEEVVKERDEVAPTIKSELHIDGDIN